MKNVIVLSLLLIFSNCKTKDEKTLASPDGFRYEFHMDGLAGNFLQDSLMNSLSIGIYHKGVKFIKHYGELDPGKKNKPEDNTIYDIGSVTKTFVGTMMAQAQLDGKLSLEDDIRNYLDGNYANLQYEDHPIKIKHLITHTSGLPKFLPISIIAEFDNDTTEIALSKRIAILQHNYSKKQFLKDLQNVALDTVPGYKYAYCNIAVEVASYILERVYEIPFEKLLEEKVWKKAKMPSTVISLESDQLDLYANGYGKFQQQSPPMKTQIWGGSGHGKSTVIDLLSYIEFQLDEKNPTVQESHRVLFDEDLIDGDPRIKMGYLWQISTDRDFGQFLKHHGGAFGMQNWMFVYPEEDLGISILTNQSDRFTAGKLLNVVYGFLDELAKDQK